MASQYKLVVETKLPQIAYRNDHRFQQKEFVAIKQSGGAGQFGEVHLRIEPKARGEGLSLLMR